MSTATQMLRIFLLLIISLPVLATPPLIKSANDTRQYQHITLENQLNVLLISDPTTDKAAVSLDLAIGSAANPKTRAGLAHFLEHMLFLGTEKYPEAGAYQAFIQANGGNHNAFTALNHTNYFFDIQAQALEPALDRFAQFFIAPLFSENYTDRERHAVHSEYSAKLRDDGRRIYAATQQAMNPDHPATRFAVGNLDTLSNDDNGSLRKDLLNFYETYYSANQMTLVMLGPQSLDELQVLAQRYFSAIKNRNTPKFTISSTQFTPGQLPAQLNVQTLKDERAITLTFPTPATDPFWRQKPLQFIASLVGYEGEGSLLALLKAQGLATGLGAYSGESYTHEASFNVQIGLTEQGIKQIDQVVSLFFAFINTLKKHPNLPALYTEEQHLSAQAFRFLARQEPIHYVVQLAQRMHDYPAPHWLDAPYRLETFDQALLSRFLKHISADNVLLTVQSPNVETHQKAPYYDTPFALTSIDSQRLQLWQNTPTHAHLHVRNTNPFISEADAYSGTPVPAATKPTLITSADSGVQAWHLQDSHFKLPETDLFFTLLSPVAQESAQALVALNLYAALVQDELNKTLYDASMAGLSASIYAHQRGLSVRISGYRDQPEKLLPSLLSVLRKASPDQARFARLLKTYQDDLHNQTKDKPYNQLFRLGYEVLLNTPPLAAMQEAASTLTLEQTLALAERFYTHAQLRILTHGDLTAEAASTLTQQVVTGLQPFNSTRDVPALTVTQLPENNVRIEALSVDHQDSAVIQYLQAPDAQTSTRAQTALLAEILSAPFYTELRTEKQLGYIVFATPIVLREQPGIALVVQSPNTDTDTIREHMDAFLVHAHERLQTLTKEELTQFKNSVIARVNEQENQLKQRTQRFWRDIDNDATSFDNRGRLTEALKQVSLADLNAALEQLQRRKLVLVSQCLR